MKNLIVGIILGMLVLIFAFQNTEIISIELFAWSFTTSRAFMVLIIFAIGLVTGWILARLNSRRIKEKKNKAKNDN